MDIRKKGFTTIELLISITVFGLLSALVINSLFPVKNKISLDTTISLLTTDLKSQQLKAMTGNTEGRVSHDAYGVYFQQDRYTLFHGLSYNDSDPSNYTVALDNGVEFSLINFPGEQIVFSPVSGEFNGYDPLKNTLTIQNKLGNEQRNLVINRYGVVTAVD